MNYYKQFAKIIGLELDEEFSLIEADGEKIDDSSYKITEEGISNREPKSEVWLSEPTSTYEYILSGDYKVVPKPWKPKEGENYWHYGPLFASEDKWKGEYYDLILWKVGNCFKTKEEAENKGKKILWKIMKEYREA